MASSPASSYRFGEYRLVPRERTLVRGNRAVALPPKAFDLLVMLVREAGHLVSKEDLLAQVWPGTFVEEANLSYTVSLVRKALTDELQPYRYIETIPKRGYRFREQVTVESCDPSAAGSWRSMAWIGSAFVVMLTVAGFALWWLRPPRPPSTLRTRQLTFHSAERPIAAATISPDGKFLAYGADDVLFVQTIATGEARRVSTSPALTGISDLAWMPDSATVIAACAEGIWRASIFGGAANRISSATGLIAMSPDGQRLALVEARSRVMTMPTGEDTRELIAAEPGAQLSRVAWSPDGGHLAYGRWRRDNANRRITIETRSADGKQTTTVAVVPGLHSLVWAPDGRIVFAGPQPPPKARFSDLWEVAVDPTSAKSSGDPSMIAHTGDLNFILPSVTADGTKLAFTVNRFERVIHTAEFDPVRLTLGPLERAIFTSSMDLPVAWSPSGDALLFEADLDGHPTMFRQQLTVREPQQLLPGARRHVRQVLDSPDGRGHLYVSANPGGGVMRAGSDGAPRKLLDVATSSARVKCALPPARSCVVGEPAGDEWVATSFDPDQGRSKRHRALRLSDVDPPWDLSPDGVRLVALTGRTEMALLLLDLATDEIRTVTSDALRDVRGIAWTRDGTGWIIVTQVGVRGSNVAHLDQSGRVTLLRREPFARLLKPLVSPDGRRIAFARGQIDSNVWMVTGF